MSRTSGDNDKMDIGDRVAVKVMTILCVGAGKRWTLGAEATVVGGRRMRAVKVLTGQRSEIRRTVGHSGVRTTRIC